MKTKLFYLLLLFESITFAQISGNQVFSTDMNKSYGKQNETSIGNTISINDNHLKMQVKVLLNEKADSFTLVIGTNQEAQTVAECNNLINKRIDGFINEIQKLKIKKENIYIDFISQTKVYDYTVGENQADEFQKGFEIKKNIIITSNQSASIEQIITTASKFEIYDIITVEYRNNDVLEKHTFLFEEAIKIANYKKDLYLKTFGKRIVGTPNASEDFSIFFPKTQYKKYQAFDTSEIQTHYRNSNQNFIKKLTRKNTTYYYEGVESDAIDTIFNQSASEIGIQYVLTLTITYKLDTSL